MQLTENECSEALTRLLRPYFAKVDVQNVYHSINKGHSIEKDSNLLTLLIQEYFDNPPLGFEELKEGMLVYDKNIKSWIEIDKTFEDIEKYVSCWSIGWPYEKRFPYEPNRFYRKEVVQE